MRPLPPSDACESIHAMVRDYARGDIDRPTLAAACRAVGQMDIDALLQRYQLEAEDMTTRERRNPHSITAILDQLIKK